jgi:hypothetical protein
MRSCARALAARRSILSRRRLACLHFQLGISEKQKTTILKTSKELRRPNVITKKLCAFEAQICKDTKWKNSISQHLIFIFL